MKVEKKNILITGAGGFIGSYLADFFEQKGERVFRILRRKNRNSDIALDLTSEGEVLSFVKIFKEKVDVVLHLAARLVCQNQSEKEQMRVFSDNIAITKNLILLAKELQPEKLINFSSIAVYPSVDGSYSEDGLIKTSPNSECMYGLAKFCSENMLDFFLGKNLKVSHMRVSQVYGDGMRQDRIFSVMSEELRRSNVVTVFGNGERRSNFISIDKLTRVVEAFVYNDLPGVYNVGDESLSYFELAQKIINQYGNADSKIIKEPSGNRSNFHLDTTKLVNALSKLER